MPEFSDEILKAVIAGTTSVEILRSVERELESSSELRERLEQLSGFTEIKASGSALRQPLPGNTLHLQQAIDGLKRELLEPRELSRPDEGFVSAGRQESPLLAAGSVVDHIEVRRLLGQGAMGQVFEGYDKQLDRKVCLKVVSPHLVGSGSATERLLREAQAAAQLQHENIVSIYGIAHVRDSPILVQQFVAGESLAQRLARQPRLHVDDILRLALQLARGLSAAHFHGIVHRDLKPDNILLDDSAAIARIADFGLARRSGSTMLTQEGIVAGTPAYMSPEQTRGEELDGRSDLFSLGIVLYTSATGHNPFLADDPYVVMDRIRTFSPSPLSEIRPDLPAWFCAAVNRLLSKSREDRPASAQELLVEFKSGDKTVSVVRSVMKLTIRQRIQWTIVVAMIATIVVGLIVFRRRSGMLKRRDISQVAQAPEPVSGAASDPRGKPVPAPNECFVLLNSNRRFDSLAAAVAAAVDDDTITIEGNGPFYSGTITVSARNLTIRAADGYTPVFRPESSASSAPHSFLVSSSGLHAKGLSIHWPVAGPKSFQIDEIGQSAVISFRDGANSVIHCSIVSGDRAVALGVGRASLTVSDSRIDAIGHCVAWFLFNTKVEIRNCWFRGGTAISLSPMFGRIQATGSPNLEISRCSFDTEKMFNIFVVDVADDPLTVSLRDSVLNVDELTAIVAMPRYQKAIQGSAGEFSVLKKLIQVSEQRCVHEKGIAYLTARRFAQPSRPYPSNLSSLDDWLSLWALAGTNSVVAEILPLGTSDVMPEVLHEFRNPSGTVPEHCGADPGLIGPSGKTR